MKKPKPECPIQKFRENSIKMEVEQIQSLLAPTVRTCLNAYGKLATKQALEWMIENIKKHEEEDEST